MSKKSSSALELKGQLLVAMPGMQDHRFERTVILICSHSDKGSMGFILNQPVASPKFDEILDELKIADQERHHGETVPVFRGGPVEKGRGFVLHSLEYTTKASTRIHDLAGITATIDALKQLVSEKPPQHSIMLLGYAGWSAGQLEVEIGQNGWLTVPATPEIIFETNHSNKYRAALASLGISEELLSANSGNA